MSNEIPQLWVEKFYLESLLGSLLTISIRYQLSICVQVKMYISNFIKFVKCVVSCVNCLNEIHYPRKGTLKQPLEILLADAQQRGKRMPS